MYQSRYIISDIKLLEFSIASFITLFFYNTSFNDTNSYGEIPVSTVTLETKDSVFNLVVVNNTIMLWFSFFFLNYWFTRFNFRRKYTIEPEIPIRVQNNKAKPGIETHQVITKPKTSNLVFLK